MVRKERRGVSPPVRHAPAGSRRAALKTKRPAPRAGLKLSPVGAGYSFFGCSPSSCPASDGVQRSGLFWPSASVAAWTAPEKAPAAAPARTSPRTSFVFSTAVSITLVTTGFAFLARDPPLLRGRFGLVFSGVSWWVPD